MTPRRHAGQRESAWRDRARCAEVAGDFWFPEKGEPVAPAQLICRRCEVRDACLEYALDHGIRHGVWGGVSPNGRERILRSREAAA